MRHGQDDENYIGGWSDVSLIPEGVVQVNESAKWIKENLNIKFILCSDVKRAVETAEIVSDVLDISFMESSELREQSKGILNGVLRTEADKEYHELLNNVTVDTIYPKGESLRDLYNKMLDYIEKIKEMEDDTLLITHRGVINMIYYILYGKELDMDKKQFGVETASVHEFNVKKNTIRRIR
jgi:probable phosphoglycerate mutase